LSLKGISRSHFKGELLIFTVYVRGKPKMNEEIKDLKEQLEELEMITI